MKTCFKCKRILPSTEFYAHAQMGDGHLGKCKECNKKDVRENYAKRREQYAEYERHRYQDENRRKYAIQHAKLHNLRNPLKNKARQSVSKALKAGKLARKPCEFCGNPKVQAHHHDYSKPLDVTWVCFKCHREKFHGQVVVSQV